MGDDYRDFTMESFADWAESHRSSKLFRIIPKFWFPRIVLSVCHLRVLRAAFDAHPNAKGNLTFEDDTTPARPDALDFILTQVQRAPHRPQKLSGTPGAPDWVSFACNYLTQQTARQMINMPNIGNVDWMFWSGPRPDVIKPYPVTQRGRSLYH